MNETTLYLAMLAGNDRTGFLEARWRKPEGGMGQCFHRTPKLRSLAEFIIDLGKRTDVYVGCGPRTHRKGGGNAVPRLFVLFVDCDSPEAIAALEQFEPRPTVIVHSGRGRHAYWQLSAPLGAEDIRRGNRRLAHHLGADMVATDPARILRPPGTLNHKSSPVPVVCEHLDVTAHNPLDVAGHLPDPSQPKRERTAVTSIGNTDDPLRAIPASIYVEALADLEVGRDGKACCPFHNDRTPSLHAYSTAERGWTCFGCGRGGSIIDFAAALWKIAPRGSGYHEIRRRLMEELRTRAAA